MKWSAIAIIIVLLQGFTRQLGLAQVYPENFAQALVANGIANPTVMAFAPDGRIFVAQQNGSLRVIKNSNLLGVPFVTLTVNPTGERGLIGITLDPDFQTNNYIYLYYTVPGTPAHNRVSRFTADGDVALPGSELILLELDPLSNATNHNGGAMHFGKDGKLYVAVGENAKAANAQNLDTYHGKLLRMNKDGSVPEGNPFTSGSDQRRRVWAYGLRNPYTFSVHPETGRILVNDVGQGTWEEINDATTGGRNFGWPATEGFFNETTYPGFTNPIFAYPHGDSDGKGCAITGGTFFSPAVTNYPAQYAGRYFFQDLCGRWINSIDPSDGSVSAPFATALSGNGLSLSVGNDGNLYYLSRTAGALFKVVYNSNTAPYIVHQPAGLTVAEGQPASIRVTALGSTPLNYQWQKDALDIPGADASTYTIPHSTTNDQGTYRVVVSNTFGEILSDAVGLVVVDNKVPIADILTPVSGTTYVAGASLAFSGSGTDVEDGDLPPDAFSWSIHFHHDTHVHDEPPITGITMGSFEISNEGETSDQVWYRVVLTVTDLDGYQGKDSVDIYPEKSTLNFATTPTGLQILLDGQPVQTPVSVVSVVGMLRTIEPITPQLANGFSHTFEFWSHGGESAQNFTTPAEDLTLVAHFNSIVGAESLQENSFSFFPNPVNRDQVILRMVSPYAKAVTVRLVNILSHTLITAALDLVTGENRIPLDLGSVQNGVYFLMLEGDLGNTSRRLVLAR